MLRDTGAVDAGVTGRPHASVEGVLCRFGIMLMPEPERALAAAPRVHHPGGRLAFATWVQRVDVTVRDRAVASR